MVPLKHDPKEDLVIRPKQRGKLRKAVQVTEAELQAALSNSLHQAVSDTLSSPNEEKKGSQPNEKKYGSQLLFSPPSITSTLGDSQTAHHFSTDHTLPSPDPSHAHNEGELSRNSATRSASDASGQSVVHARNHSFVIDTRVQTQVN